MADPGTTRLLLGLGLLALVGLGTLRVLRAPRPLLGRRTFAFLLGIFLCAAALRLCAVPHAPLKENDHGIRELAAYLDPGSEGAYYREHGELPRVLFGAVAALWPDDPAAAMLGANALLGALFVPALFLLGRRLAGTDGAGLFAAAGAAGSAWLARLAGSESPYPLHQLLFLLALEGLVAFAATRQIRALAYGLLALVLSMFVRAETLPLLLVGTLAVPVAWSRRGPRARVGLAGALLLLAGAALLLRLGAVLDALGSDHAVQGSAAVLDALPSLLRPSVSLLLQSGFVAPALGLGAFLGLAAGVRRDGRVPAFLVVWFVVAALVWMPYRIGPLEAFRVQTNLLPPLLLLAGMGLDRLVHLPAGPLARGTLAAGLGLALLAAPAFAPELLGRVRNPQVAWAVAREGARLLADQPIEKLFLVHLDARLEGGRLVTVPPSFLFAAPERHVQAVDAGRVLARGLPPGGRSFFWRGASCYRFFTPPPSGTVEQPRCREVLARFHATPIVERTALGRPEGHVGEPAAEVTFGLYALE